MNKTNAYEGFIDDESHKISADMDMRIMRYAAIGFCSDNLYPKEEANVNE